MWKVTIKQEYVYSYSDGKESKGTIESIYLFKDYVKLMNFVECAIEKGAEKTYAQIEFVEGEEHGDDI